MSLHLLLAFLLLLCSCVKHSPADASITASAEKAAAQHEERESATESERPETSSKQVDKGMKEASVEQASTKPVSGKSAQLTPPVQKQQTKAHEISLDELVERLKKTEAIGMFTKLTIRSDVLDLKESIDSYRKKGELERYVGHLRDHFDGLLLKIITLLQRDPELSRDIHLARESIWKSLVEAKS